MAFVTLLMAGVYLWIADFALHGGQRWGLGWDGVLPLNSIRALLGAAVPRVEGEQGQTPPSFGGLPFFGPGGRPPARPRMTVEERQAQTDARNRQSRQLAAVEAVAYGWQRLMWVLAGILLMVAVLSWITPWGRLWHLLAALAIFLTTTLTLAAVRYVDIPDGGALSIWPLSREQYARVLDWLLDLGRGYLQARAPQSLERLEAFAHTRGDAFTLPSGGGMGDPPLTAKTYLLLGGVFSAYGWVLLIVFARRRRGAPAETGPLPQGPP
ncbi:MAG: hypothetical protein AMXMBFR83_01220 [Phycisphaerae bacterium]